MQITRTVVGGLAIAIVVAAFLSGFGLGSLERNSTTILTSTTVTNVQQVQISGSNHSVFFVTEKVEVIPEVINEICIIIGSTNTTISSTYYLPSGGIGGKNPIGIVTTVTEFQNSSTTTAYDNVTIYNGSSSCTEINPYYGVTQSVNPYCICA